MKIRAYVCFDERNKVHFHRDFEVVSRLPEIGETVYGSDYDGEKEIAVAIREASIDTCQGNDEIYNYDYFEIYVELLKLGDDDEWYIDETNSLFVAIEKKQEN